MWLRLHFVSIFYKEPLVSNTVFKSTKAANLFEASTCSLPSNSFNVLRLDLSYTYEISDILFTHCKSPPKIRYHHYYNMFPWAIEHQENCNALQYLLEYGQSVFGFFI
jgi:hypothetical protein